MLELIALIKANLVPILSVLLALSEALALFPVVKANSVFQLIYNFLKSAATPKQP